jgi:hypothetical protein
MVSVVGLRRKDGNDFGAMIMIMRQRQGELMGKWLFQAQICSCIKDTFFILSSADG